MGNLFRYGYFFLLCTSIFLLPGNKASAQTILGRNISVKINNQKLSHVLELIAQNGDFRFSYNSNIVPPDSVVNLYAENVTIEEALDRLLNKQYEYKEAHNFVIIRYAPLQMALVLQEYSGNKNEYIVSGQIIDQQTKIPIRNASIYEKTLLESTFTNENGFFSLKLRNISQNIAITVSKENYKDLTSYYLSEVTVGNDRRFASEDYFTGDLSQVERTWLGKFLVTSGQKLQSINLGGFIARAPVQFSLSPGLSSHGSLSGQVVNKFSFSATGGYSAGSDGIEIGLLFNIDKKDVRYLQFGGAFNMVGGRVNGLQIGGLFNNVLDSVRGAQISLGHNRVLGAFRGFQVGGFYNYVRGDFNGIQISSVFNHVKQSFNGWQIGGMLNVVQENFKGMQTSVLGNVAAGESNGIQIGGIFNYAKHLKGWQIGLINMADSSSGYSIGVLNLIRNGYHKFSISTNEAININAALKTGTKQLYTQLMFGRNLGGAQKLTAVGLGFGKEISLGRHLFLNPEISSRYLYMGKWEEVNLLNRFDFNLSYSINKWISVQAGPSLNIYYAENPNNINNSNFIWDKHKGFSFDNPHLKGWIGWNAGFTFL